MHPAQNGHPSPLSFHSNRPQTPSAEYDIPPERRMSVPAAQEKRKALLKKIARYEAFAIDAVDTCSDIAFFHKKLKVLYWKFDNYHQILTTFVKERIDGSSLAAINNGKSDQRCFPSIPPSFNSFSASAPYNNRYSLANTLVINNTHTPHTLKPSPSRQTIATPYIINELKAPHSPFIRPIAPYNDTINPTPYINGARSFVRPHHAELPPPSKPAAKETNYSVFRRTLEEVLNKRPRLTVAQFERHFNAASPTQFSFAQMDEAALRKLFEDIKGVVIQPSCNSRGFNIIKVDVVCYPFKLCGRCECGLDCDRRNGEVALGWRTEQCEEEAAGRCLMGPNCNRLHSKSLYRTPEESKKI